MALIELRVSGCFGRTARELWVDHFELWVGHGDHHKTTNQRVRHFVQGIPQCLGLSGSGCSIAL